jgi:hypothetical protein
MPNSHVRGITNDMLTFMLFCLHKRKEKVADMMYSYPRE